VILPRVKYEQLLREKLNKLEAQDGATFNGDCQAVQRAAQRIRRGLARLRGHEPEVETVYSLPDPNKRQLFFAVSHRYGIWAISQPDQRSNRVIVRAARTIQKEILLPEFLRFQEKLDAQFNEVTEALIRDALNEIDLTVLMSSER
jgi:hypothetical protein